MIGIGGDGGVLLSFLTASNFACHSALNGILADRMGAPFLAPSALSDCPIPSPTKMFGSHSPDQSGSFANAAARSLIGGCAGVQPLLASAVTQAAITTARCIVAPLRPLLLVRVRRIADRLAVFRDGHDLTAAGAIAQRVSHDDDRVACFEAAGLPAVAREPHGIVHLYAPLDRRASG